MALLISAINASGDIGMVLKPSKTLNPRLPSSAEAAVTSLFPCGCESESGRAEPVLFHIVPEEMQISPTCQNET